MKNDFKRLIKDARTYNKLTTKQMALYLQISEKVYMDWEDDAPSLFTLTIPSLQKLIDLFAIVIGWPSATNLLQLSSQKAYYLNNNMIISMAMRNSFIYLCSNECDFIQILHDIAKANHRKYEPLLISAEEIYEYEFTKLQKSTPYQVATKDDVLSNKMAFTPKTKQRIYVDMDGVLATWNSNASLEEVASPGYFINLQPIQNVVNAIRQLIKDGLDVYTLSSVFEDRHSIQEKTEWLDMHLPELTDDHKLFVPYSIKKCEYLKQIGKEQRKTDILIDDYTKNLKEWHGIGIKMYNGINGTNGTWSGYSVRNNMDSNIMANQIKAIAIWCWTNTTK